MKSTDLCFWFEKNWTSSGFLRFEREKNIWGKGWNIWTDLSYFKLLIIHFEEGIFPSFWDESKNLIQFLWEQSWGWELTKGICRASGATHRSFRLVYASLFQSGLVVSTLGHVRLKYICQHSLQLLSTFQPINSIFFYQKVRVVVKKKKLLF